MKTIKHAMVLVAAISGLAAIPAFGESSQAVKLSDAELDNITAGSATVMTAIINPGKALVTKFNSDLTNVHAVVGLPADQNPYDGGKFRFVMVTNPAQTITKCSGSIGGISMCP